MDSPLGAQVEFPTQMDQALHSDDTVQSTLIAREAEDAGVSDADAAINVIEVEGLFVKGSLDGDDETEAILVAVLLTDSEASVIGDVVTLGINVMVGDELAGMDCVGEQLGDEVSTIEFDSDAARDADTLVDILELTDVDCVEVSDGEIVVLLAKEMVVDADGKVDADTPYDCDSDIEGVFDCVLVVLDEADADEEADAVLVIVDVTVADTVEVIDAVPVTVAEAVLVIDTEPDLDDDGVTDPLDDADDVTVSLLDSDAVLLPVLVNELELVRVNVVVRV